MLNRRKWLQGTTLSVASMPWFPAHAQRTVGGPWPQFPVNLIVPFPAGGPSAILAKNVAQSFEKQTGKAMRLVYKSGAGGLQGANFASKTEANGNNLLIGGSYLAVARALAVQEEFDWLEDLRPLAMVAQVPQVLVVNSSLLRAHTVTELLADLRRKPARYRMATAGIGSSSHIAAEVFKQHENVEFELVHFRGAGPALQDLLTGSVDMMLDGVISSQSFIQAGALKALMVMGRKRLPVLPEVPSAVEMGMEELDITPWYGIFAPAHLSDTQAQVIEQILQKIGQDPALAAKFETLGIEWEDLSGESFSKLVQQETWMWAQRVKRLGLHNFWSHHS